MIKKKSIVWIPLWVDKWLFGSTRLELLPDERATFIDLLCLGAKDEGYIRANETTPYLPNQIAGFLNIDLELLNRTIKKCIDAGKIIDENGIYKIANWEKYKLTSRQYKNDDDIEKEKTEQIEKNKFKKPTIQDIEAYCKERNNGIDAVQFYNFYESKGWMIGKNKMKDWKAAVRTWERMSNKDKNKQYHNYDEALFKQYCDLKTELGHMIDRKQISDWLDKQNNPNLILDRKIVELKKELEKRHNNNCIVEQIKNAYTKKELK